MNDNNIKKKFDWDYTIESPYKKTDNINLNKLYNQIFKKPALFDEIFKVPYLPYKKMKIIKDFNIKNSDLIKKLRNYHNKISQKNNIVF